MEVPWPISCSNMAPTDTRLALVVTTKRRSKLGIFRTDAAIKLLLRYQKACSSVSVHCYLNSILRQICQGSGLQTEAANKSSVESHQTQEVADVFHLLRLGTFYDYVLTFSRLDCTPCPRNIEIPSTPPSLERTNTCGNGCKEFCISHLLQHCP